MQQKITADFRAVRLDQSVVNMATETAVDMFNTRDFASLDRYIADANNKEDAHKRSYGISMLYGIGAALSAGIQSAAKAGRVKLSGDILPSRGDMFYSLKTDANMFCAQLSAIVAAAKDLGRASSIRFENAGPGHEVAREARSEGPMKVEIVGLPKRETTVSVARNSAGDIVGATHVEADAA